MRGTRESFMGKYNMRWFASTLVAMVMISTATAQPPAPTPPKLDSNTREFPAQKCRYTLPGKDWFWVERQAPHSLYFAENYMGFVVTLSVVQHPPIALPNQKF